MQVHRHDGRWRAGAILPRGMKLGADMLHLIAYDITSDRRLRRVARICEDYGIRVEKSVFECDLDDPVFDEMWRRLSAVACKDEDRIVDYPIGMIDRKRIRELGKCVHLEPALTYVF